jgi:hypothetical protein
MWQAWASETLTVAVCSEAAGSVGRRGDGGAIEARIRALGVRLLPPEPLGRDGRPICVEIPPPRRLDPQSTPQQRVKVLAGTYRAVLERRYGIKSRYMHGSAALEAHKEFPTLVTFAELLLGAGVAPLTWVVYSFDAWRTTPLGLAKRPPPSRWIWSRKRWREQAERCQEETHVGVSLRTVPEAEQLWADWRCMWLELLRCAPDTREQIAWVVEKWFPEEAFERRLSAARARTWQRQSQIDREVLEGGWPWL